MTPRRLPRVIQPSTVEIGDLISVEFPKDKGMVMTLKGRVADRYDRGDTRYMIVEGGAVILAWSPKENRPVTVTLHERREAPQTQLAIFDEPEHVEFVNHV